MTKAAIALLALAAGLLALSFVHWGGAASAVPVAAPTPTTAPAAEGRALFLSLGCTTCHRHEGLGLSYDGLDAGTGQTAGQLVGSFGAPDLTDYRPDPAFVRRWLRDPQAIRPDTAMPNFHLSDAEIEALIAFLAAGASAPPTAAP